MTAEKVSERLARFLQRGRDEVADRPWYRPPRFIVAAMVGYELLTLTVLFIAART